MRYEPDKRSGSVRPRQRPRRGRSGFRASVGVEEADGVDLVALVHMSVGVGHLLEGVADEGGDDGEVGALVDEQGDIGESEVVDLDAGTPAASV